MLPIQNTRKSRADSDALGRFYTSAAVASLLVKKMQAVPPASVLDLGCGSGNLSAAALEAWPTAQVLAVDVDGAVVSQLEERFSGLPLRHVNADVLTEALALTLDVDDASFDAAVCNPPFVRPVWRDGYAQVLAQAGFEESCWPERAQVQADVLFLAQSLTLLRDGGVLGLIAPASFVSGKPYQRLRAALLGRHKVRSVVRLPRNAFAQADARAFILILEKGVPTEGLVPVTSLSVAGVESLPVWIAPGAAAIRLDGGPEHLSVLAGELLPAPVASTTDSMTDRVSVLSDLVISVVRGSFRPGAAAAREAPHPLFHTTDFPDSQGAPAFVVPAHLHVAQPRTGITVAGPDDILLARVGRNLHRKLCRVRHGTAVMTDNVFRIRTKPGQSERVFNALTSPAGQAWLANVAYGVGARHITKVDLLRFPVQ